MYRTKLGIIGGGASGLMAAITAAKEGAEVTLLEHKDKVGKKILMTGNGKCNLTNIHMSSDYYYSNDKDYAMSILNQISPHQMIDFFQTLGLYTKEKKDGGIYPVAEQASVVLDVLLQACDTFHIHIISMVEIKKISPDRPVRVEGIRSIPDENPKQTMTSGTKSKNGKKEKPKNVTYHQKPFHMSFDKIILACGSKAASVTGSDGSGYEFAKTLQLHINPIVPALVQLHCEGDFFKSIAGVRTEAEISLFVDGKKAAQEYGELQLTDYGISGYPVFQFSRLASMALYQHKTCTAELNLIPYPILNTEEEIKTSTEDNKSLLTWLEGFINKKLAMFILKQNAMQPEQHTKDYPVSALQEIVYQLKHFKVNITKTNSFDQAQVCAGGVAVTECNMDLSLKKHPDVYVVGELLDMDGKCGGYNLQWAWVTGMLAGKSAARPNTGKESDFKSK